MRDSAVLQVEGEILHDGYDSDGSTGSQKPQKMQELENAQDSQNSHQNAHQESHHESQESLSAPQAQGKFVIRLPPGLLKKLSKISRQHQRSMNSEINLLLGRYLEEHGLVDSDSGAEEPESLDSRLRRKLNSMPAEKREALLHLLE